MVIVVNKGLEFLAKYCTQSTAGQFDYLALDSGTTVEDPTTVILTTEITTAGGERAQATVSYEASYKAKWVYTWTFTGPLAIKGCGVFNGATPGSGNSDMLMCHLFAAVKNVDDGETLQLTMKLTFAAA